MGAISSALWTVAGAGKHIVADGTLYGCTFSLLNHGMTRYGVEVSFVDTSDLDAVRKALKPNTCAVYLETPANPNLKIADISAVAALAHGYRNWYNWTMDDDTAAFKFYRSQGREDPRYWAERWNRARVGLEEEATEAVSSGFIRGETVGYALAASDIWVRLSRFGTPYPPFDYLSGMNIAPVGAVSIHAQH